MRAVEPGRPGSRPCHPPRPADGGPGPGGVHTATYDAWPTYDEPAVGVRLGGLLRRPAAERTDADKRTAVSNAAHRALLDLFGTEKPLFDTSMTDVAVDPADATPAHDVTLLRRPDAGHRHRPG